MGVSSGGPMSDIPICPAAFRNTATVGDSQVYREARKATLDALGTASLKSSRRLLQTSIPASTLTPVMLPPGQAPHKPIGDRITHASDDRNGRRRRLEMLEHIVRRRDDQVWLPSDHLAGKLGIVFRPPFAGVSRDNEVLSLDVTEPAKLLEQRSPGRNAPGFSEFGHRVGRMHNRDVVDFHRLLRIGGNRPRNQYAAHQSCELSAPHPACQDGCKSAFDAVRSPTGPGAALWALS